MESDSDFLESSSEDDEPELHLFANRIKNEDYLGTHDVFKYNLKQYCITNYMYIINNKISHFQKVQCHNMMINHSLSISALAVK